ncbi:pentatricopeptide repeat-containing protein At2g03880, mitochondrial [Cryptomeria japonica]|uniref:pentatricopeptide repeat-containing protein At2g03880, mitochondrial n=1 Tax=Cryptomeria japonica TaxID=3369 RepID=UPI0027DA6E30|nr:pentatricopeptide repeat-containing protein At2g03880, mitochondrial [Cryptomeria japonica]XP_059075775.1 pentatricopeptide repeat-containing protein At2g03880, mitochondrial [Cryptomeria japonica]XP_059075777.1 pentatricopeptide repeat-containing protein At2g03880, mitochondrial [Cryptomeria japonica]XP_059075778.1 pentatricopeptide repeat-containing protein At2g03880, mitochondrial [Cryptomeria japonica]XP_059075779.1 pentatricopeptide repeat-containing protein At2g03880, mitochondrial [Cr
MKEALIRKKYVRHFHFERIKTKMFQSYLSTFNSNIGIQVVALKTKPSYANGIGDSVGTRLNKSIKVLGIQPDYACLLQRCLIKKSMSEAKLVHAHMISNGISPHISWSNKLMSIYAKFGSLVDARQVFDKMSERSDVSWTIMIAAYARYGFCEDALKLYYEMQRVGFQLNEFTFASVLPVFANLGDLQQGKDAHEEIIRSGLELNIFVGSALVDMYVKCRSLRDARDVFDKMPVRNVVSWTAIIAGYVQIERFDEALRLFHQMQSSGICLDPGVFAVVLPACANLAALQPGRMLHEYIIRNGFQFDVFVGSALVDMYAKCGTIEDAWKVFEKMSRQDVVSWTAMIVGYAMHGYSKEALRLFEQMEILGMKPNHVTFVGVLSACCHSGLVDVGSHYFYNMSLKYNLVPRVDHYCCMVDLLGRAGYLDEAEDLINKMPMKPVAVWRSLLSACRLHGNIKLGERAAEQLINLESENAANYVLLSNIYAATGKWDGIRKVRKMVKDNKVKKNPGCSWIELNNKVHAFLVDVKSPPQMQRKSVPS